MCSVPGGGGGLPRSFGDDIYRGATGQERAGSAASRSAASSAKSAASKKQPGGQIAAPVFGSNSSTVLTSSLGVEEQAPTSGKTLLGQ